MATAKYENLASGTLSVGINTSDTSLVLGGGEGALFPSGGDFWVVLSEGSTREICKATARSTDTLTVTRNQGGTNSSFTTAATVTLVWTKQMIDQIRTDQVQSAAEASRPSTEKAGILYLPNDGQVIYRDSGSALTPWGPIFPFTAPVNGDFSWVNQGSASVSTTHSGISLAEPSGGSGNLKLRVKSAPATPYTIKAAFQAIGTPNANSYAGLSFRQTSDGKIVSILIAMNSSSATMHLQCTKHTDANTFSANYFDYDWAGFQCPVFWLAIEDDGVDRKTYYSCDGQVWHLVHTVGRTDFLTADQVGFTLQNGSVNFSMNMRLLSWKQE